MVITDQGVTRTRSSGEVEAVTWDALTEVKVVTTSSGPFAEDVYFVLTAGQSGCAVPQSDAPEGLLGRLQALPGFDNDQMIEAMGTTTDAEFVCWQRGFVSE